MRTGRNVLTVQKCPHFHGVKLKWLKIGSHRDSCTRAHTHTHTHAYFFKFSVINHFKLLVNTDRHLLHGVVFSHVYFLWWLVHAFPLCVCVCVCVCVSSPSVCAASLLTVSLSPAVQLWWGPLYVGNKLINHAAIRLAAPCPSQLWLSTLIGLEESSRH